MLAVTHSGKFHADDVLAWALLLEFFSPHATLKRTRNEEEIKKANIVFDVGGIFDPSTMRFDHHQSSYQGPLSSAGMVLHWLHEANHISQETFHVLKQSIVDYIDDVDNGRTLPNPKTPCFAQFVDIMGSGCNSLEEFDIAFQKAAQFARNYSHSTQKNILVQEESKERVRLEMEKSKEEGRNYIFFDQYVPWKKPYFIFDGEHHPTEFVIFPNLQGRWQVVAIPPKELSFAQKKSFPTPWSGLRGQELSTVIGIDGAIFCHKNLFIAVFETLECAMASMRKWDLLQE